MITAVGASLGILIVLGTFLAVYFNEEFDPKSAVALIGLALASLLVGALIGAAAWRMLCRSLFGAHRKAKARFKSHPNIQLFLDKGWVFGENPSDEERANAGFARAEWHFENGTYKGDILDDGASLRMHGRGIRTWSDGSNYDGEFLNDRPTGGWYAFPDGDRCWALMDDKNNWVFGCSVNGRPLQGQMSNELHRLVDGIEPPPRFPSATGDDVADKLMEYKQLMIDHDFRLIGLPLNLIIVIQNSTARNSTRSSISRLIHAYERTAGTVQHKPEFNDYVIRLQKVCRILTGDEPSPVSPENVTYSMLKPASESTEPRGQP
ncbi:MAG: hypothetical protein AMXMBFR58_34680 [Phycisphaerae bacterium]